MTDDDRLAEEKEVLRLIAGRETHPYRSAILYRVLARLDATRAERGETLDDPDQSAYMNLRTCICGDDALAHKGSAGCLGFDPDWKRVRHRITLRTHDPLEEALVELEREKNEVCRDDFDDGYNAGINEAIRITKSIRRAK